ncbi:biotin-dependent carboxyltransferase family protein [Gelidibacter salicanalis]|uniref:Biotin-dependent carboxyltransferase family protein n=2 Tax=Gelidibacter salicanalis TaxID=291193 RepID=A0A5C7ATN4_9FLAO|nr:biotin-dependent carboxyltransferase family protein [Gelidibacter salicanalis]
MVEVLKTGLYDSIQDLGRFGYQHLGVPSSGVMDQYAASLANSILGNQDHAAVLEFTVLAPTLKFHIATAICITGMQSYPKLNGVAIENNSVTHIKQQDVLTFGQRVLGCRGYIAVLGGFQSPNIMGSRSMCQHITQQQRLTKNDQLDILAQPLVDNHSNAHVKTPISHFETDKLHVFKGVEFGKLSKSQQQVLVQQEFTVSKDSNRMAYPLEGVLDNSLQSIITGPVLPGTVQFTPAGQVIILMRDCQTTGGYPRILQLTEMAINQLSQKTPGEKFTFKIAH